MKKFCRLIMYACSEAVSLVVNVAYIVFFGSLRNYIKRYDQPKPVCVLANGPSLTVATDGEKYEYCLVNQSPCSELFWTIRPHYYIIADDAYFAAELWKSCKSVYDALLAKVDWNLQVFVPYKYRAIARRRFSSNAHITVVPFHSGTIRRFGSSRLRHFFYRRQWAMPAVQNVVVGAIGCLIASGFEDIRLYGVDHSWTRELVVDDDNRVCLRDVHFYDNGQVRLEPWRKLDGSCYKMHECLRVLANMFESYHDLRQYADTLGVKITNCTKGSFVDAFPRE